MGWEGFLDDQWHWLWRRTVVTWSYDSLALGMFTKIKFTKSASGKGLISEECFGKHAAWGSTCASVYVHCVYTTGSSKMLSQDWHTKSLCVTEPRRDINFMEWMVNGLEHVPISNVVRFPPPAQQLCSIIILCSCQMILCSRFQFRLLFLETLYRLLHCRSTVQCICGQFWWYFANRFFYQEYEEWYLELRYWATGSCYSLILPQYTCTDLAGTEQGCATTVIQRSWAVAVHVRFQVVDENVQLPNVGQDYSVTKLDPPTQLQSVNDWVEPNTPPNYTSLEKSSAEY